MNPKKHKIILDIDNATGIPVRDVDDGLAMALALASPELEIVGFTTCAGNCHTFESTENTLRILELADRLDIPVAAGREDPLLLDVRASFEYLDGWTRNYGHIWKDVPPMPEIHSHPIELPAHEFIINMVKKYPGEITIVKEGSLTNLALALLVEPDIAPLVKSVVHMGGDYGTPWWATPGAAASNDDPAIWRHIIRMNTVYDPEATEIVIRSGIPFTFVTSKVCARVLLRPDDVEQMAAVGTPYHTFLADTTRPWVRWQTDFRGREGACMWDPLTLAVVIDPDFCVYATMHCDLKKFKNWEYPWLYSDSNTPQVQVTVDVDEKRFEEFLVERLTRKL